MKRFIAILFTQIDLIKGGLEMRTYKKFWFVFNIIFFVLGFSIPTSSSAWEWPSTFTILTTGTATGTYGQTISWASILEEQTKMKVRVIPGDNYVERARSHKAGQGILSANTVTEVFTQIEGREMHATREGGPYDIRICWANSRIPFGFIVSKDSDIKTIYDLKKKKPKIALLTTSTSSMIQVKALLAMIELDEKDVIFIPVTTWGSSTKSVPEGKADVAFASPVSAVSFEAEASARGIRWLELPKDDKEGLARYAKINRGIAFATNTKGVKSAHGVHMTMNINYYFVRANEDPELIYQLAKWLDKNYMKYKDKHSYNEDMSIDVQRDILTLARQMNYVPVHDGVIRYLKERGKWTAADTVWNDKNKEIVTRYIKAYQAAIASADQKNIKVAPDNKDWVALWESYKKNLPLFGLAQQ
jgi:TRAP transporter TAXI family solute receptor